MVTVFDSELPWITDESAHNRATSWCVPLPTFGQLKSVEISWNQRHHVSHVATEAEDLLEARGACWASLTAEKEKLQQITRSNTKFQEVLIYVDLFRSLISLDIFGRFIWDATNCNMCTQYCHEEKQIKCHAQLIQCDQERLSQVMQWAAWALAIGGLSCEVAKGRKGSPAFSNRSICFAKTALLPNWLIVLVPAAVSVQGLWKTLEESFVFLWDKLDVVSTCCRLVA